MPPDREPAARRAQRLAGRITERIARGLPVEPETLDRLLEALGERDAATALARLAQDPDACEHAPLAALLFSPGEALRRELEPLLAEADLNADGAEACARQAGALAAKPVGLLLPEGPALPYPARAEDIAALVRRLRPQATPPAELRRIIGERFGGADAGHGLGARLRHSRLAWSPARAFFLGVLLERGETAELPELIAWALGFLDLAGEDFAPRDALRQRRAALILALRQAEAFEEAQEKASFEVRMAQGQRMGYAHAPQVRKELTLLDRACRLALGIAGAGLDGGGPVRQDLGQTDDPAELLRLTGL